MYHIYKKLKYPLNIVHLGAAENSCKQNLRLLFHDGDIGVLTCWITRQNRFKPIQKSAQSTAKLAKACSGDFLPAHITGILDSSLLVCPVHTRTPALLHSRNILGAVLLVRASLPFPRSTVDPGNCFIKSTMPLTGQKALGILALQLP